MKFRALIRPCRIRVALFASFSAVTGYFLGPHAAPAAVFVPAAGIFLLACGASALNQYQERAADARMARTSGRVLPRGEAAPASVLLWSLVLIAGGLAVLSAARSAAVPGLALFALLWYNGVYTMLKRVTVHAVLVGAAAGMAPPAIGWIAAGNPLLDLRLAAVCTFFLLWQVPHFLLLLLRHGQDYQHAGLPVITGILSDRQTSRAIFSWIAASSALGLMLPFVGIGGTAAFPVLFALLAAWLLWRARLLFGDSPAMHAPALFRTMTWYMLLMMAILSIPGVNSIPR